MNTRLLLAALALPLALRAQTPAATDSLKGRIWTATARRIWADTHPRAPQPPAWPTNTAFTSWLGTQGKGEKSGIGLLRGDVVRQLGAGRPAKAAQVAQAILAEAANPPASRSWLRQLNVPALRTELGRLTPLPADTARAADPNLVTNDSTMAAPRPAETTASSSEPGFFGQHPLLSFVLGALLGSLLTYALLRATRRRSRHHRPASTADSSFSTAAMAAQSAPEVLRLQNEVQRLAHYIKELEAKLLHYETAHPADVDPTDEPALEPPVAPAELPHQPLTEAPAVGAAAAVSAAPVVPASAPAPPAPLAASSARYAAAADTPYLADADLTDKSQPELAILLSPDPAQPDEADFTLNPHADQALLLRNGLESLEQFFDYDAPPGTINLVEGTAPGRLQRQEGGWQVLERGWLHVS